jgi:DNA-binding CsgD family transcriptional regulator
LSSEGKAPLVVAIRLGDPALAARLKTLLAAVPGLRITAGAEAADVAIVSAGAAPPEGGPAEASLTARELEVLGLLTEGASNKAIARRLGISVNTAKFHVGRLIDKLDATGRTDAVATAARLGVIHL